MPTNEERRLASMLYSLVNSGENIYNNKRGDGAQRYYCDVCDEENLAKHLEKLNSIPTYYEKLVRVIFK